MAYKFATGSYDQTIRFWDISEGQQLQRETIKLNGVANNIELGGRRDLILVGLQSSVRIYDLSHLQAPVFENKDFKGNVTCAGFFNNGQYIFTTWEDGHIRIFDWRRRALHRTIRTGHSLTCAAVNSDKKEIFTGDEEGNFAVWDIGLEKEKASILNENETGIRSMAMSQNNQHIIFGDNKGTLHFYGEHMLKRKLVQAHEDYILKVRLSYDNKHLASCSADRKVKLFKLNLQAGKFQAVEERTLKGHLKWVWDSQFAHDSKSILTASTDATVKLWNTDKGDLLKTLRTNDKGIICLSLNDFQFQ